MNSIADISASLAANSQSLDSLRAQAKQSPDAALKSAARQFEAVFVNMMLKSMRDATPQDGMFDSEQTKMFTGMLDQQLAQSISSRGIGLADIMARQLSRQAGAIADNALPSQTIGGTSGPATGKAVPAGKVPNSIPSAYSSSFQQDFVQRMTPLALRASQESGVPASLMVGQAALESGWGQREIRMPDGSNSYNLFSIKATGDWKGKVAEVTTTEYRNGVPHKQVARFRAYGSYAEAFSDYAQLISKNPRYASVLQAGQAAPAAAHALQRAGYATDPHYADKLVKVMAQVNTLAG